MRILKIGVIGVGNMGRNHVRNILELPNFYELIGCFDESPENTKIIKEKFNVNCFTDAKELLSKTDAIVLAVPSSLHLKQWYNGSTI